MRPAFEEHKVDQALEELGRVLREPSGGYGAPSWAVSHGNDVVNALEELEERMRSRHMSLQHGAFPLALYAARELRKHAEGARSDIPNKDAAQIFHRCLVSLTQELQTTDQQLASEEAA
ncbi:MAG TPA: hypothetical protein VFU27_06285 [Terriglobales bacterium]|nr:hypothetical protein [Terriglobales bacterium]